MSDSRQAIWRKGLRKKCPHHLSFLGIANPKGTEDLFLEAGEGEHVHI
jgi:hypothetical protein